MAHVSCGTEESDAYSCVVFLVVVRILGVECASVCDEVVELAGVLGLVSGDGISSCGQEFLAGCGGKGKDILRCCVCG